MPPAKLGRHKTQPLGDILAISQKADTMNQTKFYEQPVATGLTVRRWRKALLKRAWGPFLDSQNNVIHKYTTNIRL
jgi:hypothetical protein